MKEQFQALPKPLQKQVLFRLTGSVLGLFMFIIPKGFYIVNKKAHKSHIPPPTFRLVPLPKGLGGFLAIKKALRTECFLFLY